MSRDFTPIQQDEVTLTEALEIVTQYVAKLKPKYGSAEETIEHTMFGFARTKSSFIEVTINSPTQISLRYENPYRRKILFWSVPDQFQKEIVLDSEARLKEEVTLFFELPSAEYQQHFADKR